MAKHLTTAEVAELHGVDPSRIRRIAKARGIEPAKVGQPGERGRPTMLWTSAQAAKLKPGPRGRPKGKAAR